MALGSVRLQLHAQDLVGALSAAQRAAQLLPQSAATQQLSLRLKAAAAMPQEAGELIAHDAAEMTVDSVAVLAAGGGAVGASRLQARHGTACAGAVHAAAERGGVAAARTLYRKLLRQQGPAAELFHAALDVELSAAADDAGLAGIRALFEAAVGAHGRHDVELWLRWLHWEAAQDSSSGSYVHWRAVKALADPTMFVAACQQLGLQQC